MYKHKNIQKNWLHYFIISLFHCLIIASCAQITAPSGGNRDQSPPVISTSTPANYSINFRQKQIKIEFDEWIQPLTNPKTQVLISPNIEPFPEIDIARNELTIKLKDTLLSNTTYSIFFGDNIKDNNEGNAFTNFKYIFSTGQHIDSLKIKGTVKTMLDKIPDNTFLLLYKEKEDSAFTKTRPFYIAKIGQDGTFSLENVKEGDYRIYALSDKNSNYYYDLPTEAIAFTDTVYHINGNLDTLEMQLFLPEDAALRIFEFDRVIKNGILHLTFNKELSFTKDEIIVQVVENKDIIPVAFQEKDAKKMTVYFPKLQSDTNNFTLVFKHNNQLIDTLRVKTESKNSKNPISFFNDTTIYKSLNVIETKPLKLIASFYGLEKPDTSKMTITDTAAIQTPFSISQEEDLQTYNFMANWKPGIKYKLTILDSAFTDLAGNFNKKQEISFLVTSVKKSGNLLITYNLPLKNRNYIAILKDNTGKVLNKQILRDSQTVKIDYGILFSGNYSVEIIDDENNNGIWNSGSFINKTLPEKIYKEPKPIIIKENWDAEEIIQVDFTKKSPNLNTNPEPAGNIGNPKNPELFKSGNRKVGIGE
ncbi:MAG TPA: Ig-like domain-containing domain [Chitinophagales bacterium]|nr:Ig-like domain-containing domain [Chitinophagales bacterium]